MRLGELAGTDVSARVPSFLAIAGLFALSLRLPRERANLWFAALTAASPLLLVYSGEARAYGVLALLDFSLFLLLFRGEPSARRLGAAAALTALALWTHYLGILFVGACALLLAARRRWQFLIALAAGSVPFLLWVPVLRAQPVEAVAWMREPLGDSLLSFASALGGAGRIPNPLGGPLPSLLVGGGIVAGVLTLIGVARTGRRDPECADAAAVTLLTMGLVFAFSLARPVAFPGRSEMAILPIWLWSVARAIPSEHRKRWIPAVLIVISPVSSAFLLIARTPESLASRAVALVASAATPTDEVVASGAFLLPARLAADRHDLKAVVIAYPLEDALHPGWFEPRYPAAEDEARLEARMAAVPSGAKIFLLLYPHQYESRLKSFLDHRGPTRELLRRPDGLVIVSLSR